MFRVVESVILSGLLPKILVLMGQRLNHSVLSCWHNRRRLLKVLPSVALQYQRLSTVLNEHDPRLLVLCRFVVDSPDLRHLDRFEFLSRDVLIRFYRATVLFKMADIHGVILVLDRRLYRVSRVLLARYF